MSHILDILDDFVSLLFPRLCQACGDSLMRNEKLICTDCYVNIPRTNYHLEANNAVEKIFWGRCKLERAAAFSFFNKDSHIRELIHNLKYRGVKDIGTEIGRIYARDLLQSSFLDGIDMIIPVPLHTSKLKSRGFNQSEEIARGLSEVTNIPVNTTTLKRSSSSPTQTKRSRFDRWTNVEGKFSVTDYTTIDNKHILLVDDVITTGATIESCANELLKGINTTVSVIAVAITTN